MTLKTASVLAFERKLDPSDAVLFAGQWDERDHANRWSPIELRTKSVRGTISNRLKKALEADPTKLDAEVEKPNLQTVDTATLPHDNDTLLVRYTLRVLGGAGTPSVCNDVDYQAKLQQTVNQYVAEQGFKTLAQRYAANIANGRFLWRNRLGAESIEIRVAQQKNGAAAEQWVFNAFDQNLRDLETEDTAVGSLAAVIEQGLAGDSHVLLHIEAYARVGAGQEVYPSQELLLDGKNQKDGKSKTLYQVNGIAGMHSQKIGNALRTIDTWYPSAEELGPIAVEPYGSVTTQGKAYRQPKEKQDFYSLLDGWILKDKVPATEQQHFVMATLVRGGVFGAKAD